MQQGKGKKEDGSASTFGYQEDEGTNALTTTTTNAAERSFCCIKNERRHDDGGVVRSWQKVAQLNL